MHYHFRKASFKHHIIADVFVFEPGEKGERERRIMRPKIKSVVSLIITDRLVLQAFYVFASTTFDNSRIVCKLYFNDNISINIYWDVRSALAAANIEIYSIRVLCICRAVDENCLVVQFIALQFVWAARLFLHQYIYGMIFGG